MKTLNYLKHCLFVATSINIHIASAHEFQLRYGSSIRNGQNTTQLAEATYQPEYFVDFNSGWKLNALLRLRHEATDGLATSDLDQSGYSRATKPWLLDNETELELREFYFERSFGKHFVSVGKQQIVWGRTDGIKTLDVVNPQSFREFVLEDFEDSRIPLWSANIEFGLPDSSTLQALWIPDTTTHALPTRVGRFAFTTPRIVPQAPEGIPVQLNQSDRPNDPVTDSDFGLRWSAFKSGWDLTINYLYHYDDLPVFSWEVENSGNGPSVEVTPQYSRSHLIGGTFTNSFGDLTLRGEIGYESDKALLSRDPTHARGVTKHDTLSYAIGFDWFGLSDTFISLQVFQSHVIKPSSFLTRPENDTTLTLSIQRDFLNETLKTEILLLKNLDDSDGMIRPKITYEVDDHLSLSLGADILYGERTGLFGQFKDKSRLHGGVTYSF